MTRAESSLPRDPGRGDLARVLWEPDPDEGSLGWDDVVVLGYTPWGLWWTAGLDDDVAILTPWSKIQQLSGLTR